MSALPGGLLRITIDLPWQRPTRGSQSADLPEAFITVEDCEKVTRQLQFALEVDGVDYQRLEVSSPGIDRLLRHEHGFCALCGRSWWTSRSRSRLALQRKARCNANRKKFRGTLERADDRRLANRLE